MREHLDRTELSQVAWATKRMIAKMGLPRKPSCTHCLPRMTFLRPIQRHRPARTASNLILKVGGPAPPIRTQTNTLPFCWRTQTTSPWCKLSQTPKFWTNPVNSKRDVRLVIFNPLMIWVFSWSCLNRGIVCTKVTKVEEQQLPTAQYVITLIIL